MEQTSEKKNKTKSKPLVFANIYKTHPNYTAICNYVQKPKGIMQLRGLGHSATPLLLAAAFTEAQHFFVVLTHKEEAAYFFDDLQRVLPPEQSLFFPSSYKRAPKFGNTDSANIILRTEVLNKVSENKRPYIIVTWAEAFAEKVTESSNLEQNTLHISVGEKVSMDFVTEMLAEYDFERADFVYEPGQYSVRGGIIDIFSFAHDRPYRIDFFDDEVESIRIFNPENQLSVAKLESISIIPNLHKTECSNYVPIWDFTEKPVFWLNSTTLISDKINTIGQELAQDNKDEGSPEPDYFVSSSNFNRAITQHATLDFGLAQKQANYLQFSIRPQPEFNKNFELVADVLQKQTANGFTNYILTDNIKQADRIDAIFDAQQGSETEFEQLDTLLHSGFVDTDLQLSLYTDHQLFGRYHKFNIRSEKIKLGKNALTIKEINNLQPGDYVVHDDHGIGRFGGLQRIDVSGTTQETVRLVFKDNDIIYVSIHSLHKVSKYKGKDGDPPRINKLGTGAWQKLKQKARGKIKDIAKDLIKLYAERRTQKGFAFSEDTYLQQALEASFIYEDTPDQVTSTEAVKADMEKDRPMDRLVCGDVGFGKTEIAMRAAFKAVTDSKQVAILVPTTILALQHFKTFSKRLHEFPVTVEYISRMRKPKEVKETLKNLAEGKTDIIIGTHRLIGKDVAFKNLGLLIIDEEQKFGVAVKEKLKQFRVDVDTLTLTATPIPRTLQFSLMGARDLSVINTPPPNRYPIATELHEFNESIIKEAIDYEIERNGQAFIIHNRVQSINDMEAMINRICPNVSTVVAHGQMEGKKLEQTMSDFINEKYGVLIATTIIESGLDIPNANTIIINNAQNFGLSELHQLRGRVGRSNKKAFCYLLAPPQHTLKPDARRRLKAIEDFSELGSGFNISLQDLDIRGAGNLLGGEQSGFITDIGFETYHRILNEAMLELRQTEFKDVFTEDEEMVTFKGEKLHFVVDCQIDTDLELLFPDDYVESISERMKLYRELDNIQSEEELLAFEKRVIDRFGKIPQQAKDLMNVVRIRREAMNNGMERLILKADQMVCYFVANKESKFYASPEFGRVLLYVQHNATKCNMKQNNEKLSLVFKRVGNINKALQLVNNIQGHGKG